MNKKGSWKESMKEKEEEGLLLHSLIPFSFVFLSFFFLYGVVSNEHFFFSFSSPPTDEMKPHFEVVPFSNLTFGFLSFIFFLSLSVSLFHFHLLYREVGLYFTEFFSLLLITKKHRAQRGIEEEKEREIVGELRYLVEGFERERSVGVERLMGSSTGSGSGSGQQQGTSGSSYDLSFKILLIGDSAVGKSSLLVSFISNTVENLSPTIGVDFKIKQLTVGGKRLKLTIWDTAGQERFRTLTSSYYRGAQGIILVYDVTRRESFTNLSDVWAKEVDLYSTNQDCIKMLVGNKVDKDSERAVTREEGIALAQSMGCLFLECSAITRENVQQCFEELALKIMEVPSLLDEGSTVVKRNILKQKQEYQAPPSSGCCS